MNLRDIMTRDIEVIQPHDTLQMAARKMRERDIGFLPMYEGDQLIGVLTDRDLAVRAVADGLNPEAILGRDMVTAPAIYCFDDQDAEDAAWLMYRNQIRRLMVLDRNDKRPLGIISLGDLVGHVDDQLIGQVLQSVSAPVKSPS